MRRGRQKQQVGCGFCESLSQTIPGDVFGAATKPVGLIADNQIPPGVDEVTEAFLIVGFQFLLRPTSPLLNRLDGIDGAHHLIELPPDVLEAGEVAPQRKLTWREEPEFLAEVRLHFLNPLRNQTLRRNHKDPLDQTTKLQFPEDQPSLDGLAQANLIGQ